MRTISFAMTFCHLALFNLLCASVALAENAATPQQPAMPWWHEAQGHSHSFWWIFPLMFFVMMIVVFIFMMRRGGPGCMWRDWMMDSSELRDATMRKQGQHSETALEILDKRYAKGEIEKQEYEEKKAAIARSI